MPKLETLTLYCRCSVSAPAIFAFALFFASAPLTLAEALQDPSLIGRWDLTVEGLDGSYPSWLEVRKSGFRTLVGSFVGRFGSARPVAKITFDGQQMRFAIPPQWESRTDDLVFEGRLRNGKLSGETNGANGKTLRWTGTRAPPLKRNAEPHWGEMVSLFDGQSLQGWAPRFTDRYNGWEVTDKSLSNANPGNDLITTREFDDFKLLAEFRYPEGSNSGIYLRGRYEVQIEDNYGQEPECHKIGGVYGFLTPSTNAAKPAGEWQKLEITLVGRVVTVALNGERIIDRQTIPGITGGAIDNDEAASGPLMIQGDHGPVAFRKLMVAIPVE